MLIACAFDVLVNASFLKFKVKCYSVCSQSHANIPMHIFECVLEPDSILQFFFLTCMQCEFILCILLPYHFFWGESTYIGIIFEERFPKLIPH